MKKLSTRRDILLSGTTLMLLAGCSDLMGPPPASQLYILRPGEVPLDPGPKVTWSLTLQSPVAPDNLDSQRISLVRGNTMDFYANAEWPERLTDMVQTALLEGFEHSNRIDRVSRSEDGIRSDYLLQTDIRNCEARYETAEGAPALEVRIAARLVRTADRRIVSTVIAERQIQAARNSVPAVVDAMDQALGAVIALIVNWALAAPAPTTEINE